MKARVPIPAAIDARRKRIESLDVRKTSTIRAVRLRGARAPDPLDD
jgi:hypothetical protein